MYNNINNDKSIITSVLKVLLKQIFWAMPDQGWKKCKFPRKIVTFQTNFPPCLIFLFMKSHNFPPNGQISREGASQVPHLFPLCA